MLPLAHNCYIFEQSIVYVQHWQSIIYAQNLQSTIYVQHLEHSAMSNTIYALTLIVNYYI